MIYAVKGKIFEKSEGKIAVMTNCGVVYEINVSLLTFSKVEDEVLFYITEVIKENEYSLYGFVDKNEKKIFDMLLKINGVGPKVALGILSTLTPEEFVEVVKNKDIKTLTKVPGIGPKSAKRILMEMGEFELDSIDNNLVQVIIALENLGFKKSDILKALQGESGSVEELIKKALKKLGGF